MLTDTLAARRPATGRLRPADHGRTSRGRAGRGGAGRGRVTARRLLAAGLAEFSERGYQAVTVDDIVHRARTSHGTFYLYFANKDDFFAVLSAEALRALDGITDEFPVVTPGDGGQAALRNWVSAFCDVYEAHATVIRILSQADIIGPQAWGSSLERLFRLAEVVSAGMTAGRISQDQDGEGISPRSARLDALACMLMLERANYLLSSGISLPRPEIIDRLTAIIIAAFHSGQDGAGAADGTCSAGPTARSA